MTRLAIVIVSFNAKDDLHRCLASLGAAPPACSHEILVIDNASSDGSPDMVLERHPGVRLIARSENVGFARANNEGIRRSSSDLVLLLNSDTIVPAGAVDRLVSALETDSHAAAVGPRLVDADGHTELSFGSMVGPLAELRQKRLGRGIADGRAAALAQLERLTRAASWPDWVSAACLLVWRHDAEAVGLLDERYFMYLEDVDFCAALRAHGRRIRFEPAVTITHLRGRSRRAAAEATERAYRQSHIAFYRKHHPGWAPLLTWYLRAKGQARW
jgi:N-acetylglucosaminyl-diphospho-decaprenol L-rhamnosyltransferase